MTWSFGQEPLRCTMTRDQVFILILTILVGFTLLSAWMLFNLDPAPARGGILI